MSFFRVLLYRVFTPVSTAKKAKNCGDPYESLRELFVNRAVSFRYTLFCVLDRVPDGNLYRLYRMEIFIAPLDKAIQICCTFYATLWYGSWGEEIRLGAYHGQHVFYFAAPSVYTLFFKVVILLDKHLGSVIGTFLLTPYCRRELSRSRIFTGNGGLGCEERRAEYHKRV